jgi:hypothetical protein
MITFDKILVDSPKADLLIYQKSSLVTHLSSVIIIDPSICEEIIKSH